jgi:hypothetical protein
MLLALLTSNCTQPEDYPNWWCWLYLFGMIVTMVTTMTVTTVKDFKAHATRYMKSSKTVLITRHGKAAGFFIPVDDPSELPFELRQQLLLALAAKLRRKAQAKGVTEAATLAKFQAHRAARRRR